MNIKVLGCQPLRRELYALAALSPHEVVLDLISPNSPPELLQQKINAEIQARPEACSPPTGRWSLHEYIIVHICCWAAPNAFIKLFRRMKTPPAGR